MADTKRQQYIDDLNTQIAKVNELHGAYSRLAQKQINDLGDIRGLEEQTQEEREKAAEARHKEADALEHNIKLLEELGAEQRSINALQRHAIALRVQAAQIEGKSVDVALQTKKLELEIARQVEGVERDRARAFGEAIGRAKSLDDNLKRIAGHQREAIDELQRYRQIELDIGTGAARLVEGWDRATERIKTFGGAALTIASKLGSIVTGIQSAIDLTQRAISAVDEYATESGAVQATARNLQLDITAAREEVDGLVSDYELARLANRAYAMDVADTGDEFAEIVGLVRTRARQLGTDQQQLIADYIEAVGKQEAEIFDNLGLTLRLTDAYNIFAESLGKSAKDLTDSEKAAAFQAAALEKLREATGRGAAEVEGFANAWQKAKVSYDDFKREFMGFDDTMGRVREALRELSNEKLQELRFGEMLDRSGSIENIKMFDELTGMLGKWNVSLVDLRMAADELGVSYQQMLEDAMATNDAEAEAEALEQAKSQQSALVREKVAEADEIDHINELLGIQGDSARNIILRQIESLEIRKEAAEIQAELTKSTEDEAKALAIARKIEVLRTKLEKGKYGKKGRGSTEADIIRAEGDARVRAAEDELKLLELRSRLVNKSADVEYESARRTYEIELERLDVEQRSLGVTRAKNKADRIKNEARIAAIGRDRQILLAEKQLADREREVELVQRAVEATQKQAAIDAEIARQEAAGIADVIRLEDFRAKQAEQDIRTRGETAAFYARTERERLTATQTMEAELHQHRMAQMRREYEAEVRALDARQTAAGAMDVSDPQARLKQQDEYRQIAHDREMGRLEFEMGVRRAMEQEQIAMQQRERERWLQMWSDVEAKVDAFEGFRSEFTQLGNFLTQRNAEEEDAALQRTIRNMEARGRAQKEALDAEIAAAEGNVALQNQLRKKQAKQEAQLQRQIELAEAQHQDRRKRQEMKAAGIQLLITAAVEGVKAVAAFASFNYIEGALHVAAAAVAGAQAAMLLSGKIPGGGAVANMSSGGAGMDAGASNNEYVDPSSVPGSVPGEAARRESATPSEGKGASGGNVINIYGDINSLGTIDQDAAENIGRTLGKVAYSREA